MADDEMLNYKWNWNWLVDDFGLPWCGIHAEPQLGQAYSITRCPQYLTKEQWTAYATHICDLHNAALEDRALAEFVAEQKEP